MFKNNGSLVSGIGNAKKVTKFYDQWSKNYDNTLKKWNYNAPKQVAKILYKKFNPKILLDLACGTGLSGQALIKYKPSIIDGSDISSSSLKIAKKKNIYNNIIKCNFQKKLPFKKKHYDAVLCVGSLTYCNNFEKLIDEIYRITKKRGIFIFTHRNDLWKSQNFDYQINKKSKVWKKVYLSKSRNYLPLNNDFSNLIKIKICILKKIN